MYKNKDIQFKIIVIVIVWLIPVIIFLSIYLLVPQEIVIPVESKEATVNVGVTVVPDNPIDEVKDINKEIDNKNKSFSDIRITTRVPLLDNQVLAQQKIVNSQHVLFKGNSKYHNSSVILEFPAEELYINLESDGFGNWSWSNKQTILNPGQYEVIVYNFNNIEIVNQKEVLIERHQFIISNDVTTDDEIVLDLNNETINIIDDLNSIEKHFFDNNHPIFIISLDFSNEEYIFKLGDDIDVNYNILSSQVNKSYDANIEYELQYDNGGELYTLDEFKENFLLSNGIFNKELSLTFNANPATYLLNSKISVNNSTYLQSKRFQIVDPNQEILSFIESKSNNSYQRIILWNFLFFVIILNTLLTFIVFEYNRIFIYGEMSEDDMNKLGYF